MKHIAYSTKGLQRTHKERLISSPRGICFCCGNRRKLENGLYANCIESIEQFKKVEVPNDQS